MAENYIALDLNDPRTKGIAETISNPTCKKILSLLAEKDLSESDLSSKLSLPINTVEYNIKKLIQSGLIEKSKGFFWSVKGKKIPTYKISNKKIIISPRTSFRGILPAILGSIIVAVGIKFYSFSKTIKQAVQYVAPATDTIEKTIAAAEPSQIVPSLPKIMQSQSPEIWPWFLLGALTAILIILIYNMKGGK